MSKRKEKEKKYFIKWLKKFFLMNELNKIKFINKALKENATFGQWLDSVKIFTEEQQKELIKGFESEEWN